MVLVNESPRFAAQALAGYAESEPRVLAVPGGVVRSNERRRSCVSVVSGGGSGHFPAFAGWVGPGFLHGAACGNVFASPSYAQILEVTRATDVSDGVLYLPINYAGDILNFGTAAEILRSEGVDVRIVPITDDIASGPIDRTGGRRGIAGSFFVIKTACAAAEQGASLDELEALAVQANQATRTFGVAFRGCTVPGSDAPLFEPAEGHMGVGLGIHGEAGIDEVPLGTADEVADLLVDGLFTERPPVPGARVAVIVNGLGSTKYDELHIVFARVARRLDECEMHPVAPVVGEVMTSLDMAGLSLSLTYLNDRLKHLWLADADTHAFSRSGATVHTSARSLDGRTGTGAAARTIPPASDESRALARAVVAALRSGLAALRREEHHLRDLDAVAGDGDHGAGMVQGCEAALAAATEAVAAGSGTGWALQQAGSAWADEAGGTSGILWGGGLRAAGQLIGDENPIVPLTIARAVREFSEFVIERGGAQVGDKTMVDAVVPFADSLEAEVIAGASSAAAWRRAAEVARRAAEESAGYAATRGRSRIHGDRSVGTPDPGATSFALLVSAVAETSPLR